MIKEKLVAEAEALADSTDWGQTTGAYRDLMTRWKAAGPAPRGVDEALWKRFRGAQDTFFAAKQATMTAAGLGVPGERRSEGAVAGRGREAAADHRPGGGQGRVPRLLGKWAAIGKVPRDAIRPLDNRLRAIETAIAAAEEERWRRNNPEARARAEDTAAKLEAQIAALEERAAKAEARGDHRAAREAAASAATYREWLAQAQRPCPTSAAEFLGDEHRLATRCRGARCEGTVMRSPCPPRQRQTRAGAVSIAEGHVTMTSLTKLSLANRLIVGMATVAIVIFGVLAALSLRQELLPSTQVPTAIVTATYPGATPEIVAREVAKPLGQAIGGVSGVTKVRAVSTNGLASLTVEWTYGLDNDELVDKIRTAGDALAAAGRGRVRRAGRQHRRHTRPRAGRRLRCPAG